MKDALVRALDWLDALDAPLGEPMEADDPMGGM